VVWSTLLVMYKKEQKDIHMYTLTTINVHFCLFSSFVVSLFGIHKGGEYTVAALGIH
jgi:hypothetical protein